MYERQQRHGHDRNTTATSTASQLSTTDTRQSTKPTTTRFASDDRGISTAVTHALTLGITALLLLTLIGAAGGFLQEQENFAARDELDTIGSRMADQFQQTASLAVGSGQSTIYSTQPQKIVGNEYRVHLRTGSACDTDQFTTDACLELSVDDRPLSQKFPLSTSDRISLDLRRVDEKTFALVATETTATAEVSTTVPMSRSLRLGVGSDIDRNTYSRVIDPTNRPPIAKFTFDPDFPTSGSPVTFDAGASRDPDGSIITYQWYVDGSVAGANSETLTRSLGPGKHNVTLFLEDDEGGTTTRTRMVRVSGLEYNNDMGVTAGSGRTGGNCASFSITNDWSSDIRVTHLSIDPPDKVNKIEENKEPEIAFDTNDDGDYTDASDAELETGAIDVRDKPDGVVIALRENGLTPLVLSPSQTISTSVCKFKGGGPLQGQEDFPEFGFRYWVRGSINRTVFGGTEGPVVSDYSVDSTGSGVTVSFDASERLDTSTFDAEIGDGSTSTAVSGSAFSESSIGGGSYAYEATLSRPAGTYYVRLDDAENTKGVAVAGLPKSDSTSIIATSSGYTWETAGDWDSAQVSSGVVHDSYGDYEDDVLELGRPPGSVDSSLISYWPLDGGSADDIYGGNDGNIRGAPAVTDGIAGTSGLRFDGYDDYIEVPDDSSLEASDDDQVTVSMWVNKHRKGSSWRALFQNSDESYNMQFANGNQFEFTIYDDDTWYDTDSFAIDSDNNAYYHLVGTFDGAEIRSYVDGSLVGSEGGPDRIDDGDGYNVGIAENVDSSGRHVNADIDDIRLYDDALSGGQVEELYNVTKGSLTTDKRSGATISKKDLELSYDADIDRGETIEFRVFAEVSQGNGMRTIESDVITLGPSDSGTGTVDVSGINKDASTFWVRTELESASPKQSPELSIVQLQEGS